LTPIELFVQDNYKPLRQAALNISNNSGLAEELLHYTLDAFLRNPKVEEIVDCGAGRWFCIKIMTNSWKSVTSPFYHTYRNNPWPLEEAQTEPFDEEDPTEELAERAKILLGELPWYDRKLFELFVDEGHTISSLARAVGIPRTSVSLTINRVKKHLRKNI
jgi:DNA-directed RNA polymerase specialized sigma24 family protein